MLGILLVLVLFLSGFYLVGNSVLCKLRCKEPVAATIIAARGQSLLTESGSNKKIRFSRYQFVYNNKEYIVTDFDAPNNHYVGDSVSLFCDSKNPNHHWYLVGTLRKDTLIGCFYILLALALLLFLMF